MATRLGTVRIEIADAIGGLSYPHYYLNMTDSQTIAQAVTEAQALATLLDPLTDGQINAVVFQIQAPLPGGIKGAPVSTTLATSQGVLSFTNDSDAYKWQVPIPAISGAVLSGRHINTGNAAVIAFVNHLLAVGNPFRYAAKWGGNLVALSHSFLSIRKRAA